jgi:ubiquinone/menaquinone biosynthesis C-methylase UbiE
MSDGLEQQQRAFDKTYQNHDPARWDFHDTSDRLTRYLRDRRLSIALAMLRENMQTQHESLSALVVCGGVGGEGTFLANNGFAEVTVSDFSDAALSVCQIRDDRLRTLRLNAEAIELPDESYDVVLVQDGLHHLTRPALGLSEMLRVARRAVIVIEPHSGIVGRVFGTTWEHEEGATNYVFRWNTHLLREVTYSYLVNPDVAVCVKRIWDHNVVMARMASVVRPRRFAVSVARVIYGILDTLARPLGNMFIAVVVKAET